MTACLIARGALSDNIFNPILVVIVVVVASASAWSGYRRWHRRRHAPEWPIASATVQGDFAAPINSRYAPRGFCQLVLQYSYQVAGEFYSGYLMLPETFPTHEDAHSAAQPWLGKAIRVRYNPERPQESAYLPADGAPEWSCSLGDQPPDTTDLIDLALK